MFRKFIAGAGIALVALFAAPAAAHAGYAPDGSITVTGSPVPGGTVTVTIDAAFEPGEQISFTLTGESASSATLGVFKAAVSTKSITKAANAAGTAAVDVTLPSNASGTYTVTATGLTSGIIGTAAVTVVAADGSGNGDGLAITGGTALTAIWITVGALTLGIVLLLVRTLHRKATSV